MATAPHCTTLRCTILIVLDKNERTWWHRVFKLATTEAYGTCSDNDRIATRRNSSFIFIFWLFAGVCSCVRDAGPGSRMDSGRRNCPRDVNRPKPARRGVHLYLML